MRLPDFDRVPWWGSFALILVGIIVSVVITMVHVGLVPPTDWMWLYGVPMEAGVAGGAILIVAGVMLQRKKHPLIDAELPFKEQLPFAAFPYGEPNQAPQYQPRAAGFEGVIEEAMRRNLIDADIDMEITLPPDSELNILGQKWRVGNASIHITKAGEQPKPEPKPTQPEEMPLQ